MKWNEMNFCEISHNYIIEISFFYICGLKKILDYTTLYKLIVMYINIYVFYAI